MFSVHHLSIKRLGRVLFTLTELTIDDGDLLIIKGGNGVGKTTLLLTLCTLLKEKGLSKSHDGARDYFFLPQAFALLEDETVEENLRFYTDHFKGHAVNFENFQRYDPFSLETFQKRYVGQLSHGEKRRVSLSRLIGEVRTPLWLLDEPEQGLDVYFQGILHCVIADHRARKGAVIIVTHSLDAFLIKNNIKYKEISIV